MTTEDHKEAVRRLAQEGWTEHNMSAFDDFFAEDAVWHGLESPIGEGIQEIKQAASFWFEAVPDFTFRVKDLTAEQDRVAFWWDAEGTHKGELFGVPPTNQRIQFSGCAMKRFASGKCVEYREVWDRAGLMQQLGIGSG